ncbi:hypothetical protein MMC07_001731 [Pseudocyphellaria aurata]|nr:hypothetical protein [Pseudocyphellaria aurata]
MPVTIRPSPDLVGRVEDKYNIVHSAEALLKRTARTWSNGHAPVKSAPVKSAAVKSRRLKPTARRGARHGPMTTHKPERRSIIQSSFADLDSATMLISYDNGFVKGIIQAYRQDLHLVLRPDDIWLSILTQFSMFVNANAETLRAHFVAHEDKKKLEVDIRPYSVDDIDMGKFAQEMTLLIHQNVVDVELRDWILPKFSTTSDHDTSVAAIVMMGTLQKYFDYQIAIGCGFPSVTLLGEKSDWEEILRKVQVLPKYGEQPTEWSRLLIPIVDNMIASFDQPDSQLTKDFWLRTCHSAGGSVSPATLSGWLTAFCFWDESGVRIKSLSDEDLSRMSRRSHEVDRKRLILNEIEYPLILRYAIPKGVVSVPVTVQDHRAGLEYKTTMVAGSVGMTATAVDGGEDLTTVQPRSGWWMLEDSVEPMS